jgi:hypothetical protein
MKTKIIISGLAFLAITTLAGAQNNGASSSQGNCSGKNVTYVDSNKNGICDNHENSFSGANSKKKGYGKCNGKGSEQRGMGQGKGKGKGQGQGQGRRINFIDANSNGICDNYEVISKK